MIAQYTKLAPPPQPRRVALVLPVLRRHLAKKDQMVDNACDTAKSAKESCQEAGQQMKAKAQGAADAVKDAVNK
ncbi:hypothetical protein Scep_022303 [Stephania cephalantha]|uniref:Uncharacterized protein n=1 Tax=Stephania cephalantha TaxID=152367 RepID=A0AAP0FH09_9MAGN